MCADIPTVKRWAVSKLVGTLPTATFDEALQYFLRASTLYVGSDGSVGTSVWLMNALWIIKTHLSLKNSAAATAEAMRALAYVDTLPAGHVLVDDDAAAIDEIKQLQIDHRLR